MRTGTLTSRRRFLRLTGSLAAGIALPAIPAAVLAAGENKIKKRSEPRGRSHARARGLAPCAADL